MSWLHLLHNPTLNSANSIIPKNNGAMAILGLFLVAVILFLMAADQNFPLACLMWNYCMVYGAAMAFREQLTYPFTACLPHFQVAMRRHLVVIGLVANLALTAWGLLTFRTSPGGKLLMAEMMMFGGLACYFLFCRLILSIRNVNSFHFILILPLWFFQIFTDTGIDGSFSLWLIANITLAGHAALVIACLLAFAWYWRLLDTPYYFRRIMDMPVPGGYDSMDTLPNVLYQNEDLQRLRDRKQQSTRLARWIADIRLPGHSCIMDHLNIVLGRSLIMLLSPGFGILTALLVFGNPLMLINGREAGFLGIYALGLPLYLFAVMQDFGVSPLLPASRMMRAAALLAADLFALLLFWGYFLVTWQAAAGFMALISDDLMIYTQTWHLRYLVALLLVAPVNFLVYLVLTIVRSAVFLCFFVGIIVIMIASAVTYGVLFREMGLESLASLSINLAWWIIIGWGVYLFFMFYHFLKGSLVHP